MDKQFKVGDHICWCAPYCEEKTGIIRYGNADNFLVKWLGMDISPIRYSNWYLLKYARRLTGAELTLRLLTVDGG